MCRESQSKKKETRANLGGRQMDNTNRKCIFGNDLLQGTQSNVFFFVFLYGLFFLGYNYMTAAWQRNLATTTVTLEKYNNNSNKTEKS